MDRRTTSLSGTARSRHPKVGEVLHTVDTHEEVYDEIHTPWEACAGLIGEDKASKREIKIGGLGAGATRKRRRRDSVALLNEEANRFIGQGSIGTKGETYVTIV